MSRKSETKLFKLVCKQSALMRAPFRNSSWTNKTADSDKKTSIINKPGEKFRLKVAKLSIGKTWSEIKKVSLREKVHSI